jgi:hypothetical protein
MALSQNTRLSAIGYPYSGDKNSNFSFQNLRFVHQECTLNYVLQISNLSTPIVRYIREGETGLEDNRCGHGAAMVSITSTDAQTNATGNMTSRIRFGWPADHVNWYPEDEYFISYGVSVAASNLFARLLPGVVQNGASNFFYSTDFMKRIWESSDDMGEFTAWVAVAMTENMKRSSPARDWHGAVAVNRSKVVVRWRWLILSGTLVFLSCTYLISSIIQTCKAQVKAWRDSILPLLFVKIDPELRAKGEACLDRTEKLDEIGKEKVVMLVEVRSWTLSFSPKTYWLGDLGRGV